MYLAKIFTAIKEEENRERRTSNFCYNIYRNHLGACWLKDLMNMNEIMEDIY